jgi:arylsulfatase A-like enzyme
MSRPFNVRVFFLIAMMIAGACVTNTTPPERSDPSKPNIVYILADDMGYGDVSCNYPAGKTRTPNIDRLASEGMRFTDAHAPSSVCTPSRYALLTGEYAWRSRLPKGVLRGYGRSLIKPTTSTVGGLLQQHGYHTAVIGKWHLGLDWKIKAGHEAFLQRGSYAVNDSGLVQDMDPQHIDFSTPPSGGPLSRGFDESFILPASLDMDPYCFLKNDTLLEAPSGYTPGNDLGTGYTGAFWRAGKMAPSFRFDEALPTFTSQAISYLHRRASVRKPFFLYLAFSSPHTPWVPTPDYQGKSAAGSYGDFVQMVDAQVGKVLRVLDSLHLNENTLVIFASDNGPYWRPAMTEKYGHRAAGAFRGMKADAWEGGHRIPLIVRWPQRVKAGTVSPAPTTLANLMATCADILGIELPERGGRDSYSILPVLLQRSDTVPNQMAIVHHSSLGYFAVRQGPWKLIEGLGSGGFSDPQQYTASPEGPSAQLYNLAEDPSEENNLYLKFPGKVTALRKVLQEIKEP